MNASILNGNVNTSMSKTKTQTPPTVDGGVVDCGHCDTRQTRRN